MNSKNSKEFDLIKEEISLLNSKENSIKKDSISQEIIEHIKGIENDSLRNEALFLLSYAHFQNNDSVQFLKTNKLTFELSFRLKDTAKIAEAFYDRANFFYTRDQLDSAFINFNEAQKLYSSAGKNFLSAKMLLYIAYIQKDIHDYTGSEINTIQAIKAFKPLKKDIYLFSAYNNLGIVYGELAEYDNALNSYEEAKKYLKRLKDEKFEKEILLNNIGLVYSKMEKYDSAEDSFRKVLANKELLENYPKLYAMALDNLAYSEFKQNREFDVQEKFLKSLMIREGIDHTSGIIINKIHLGEYHLKQNDSANAKQYFISAKKQAEETNNFRDLLKSLLFLSQINDDKETLNRHIKLSDSLQKEERAIRNKFARIRFETDEFIEANEQLTEQKQWMIISFSSLAFSLIFLIFLLKQRSYNKELKLKQEQQTANEEIYNLLIKSQEKLEEGQDQERKRISRDLHDGILSQFFGIRLNLEFLNDKLDKSSIKKRQDYIKELRSLEKEIRDVSHQLNKDTLGSELSFLKIIEELLLQQEQINNYRCKINVEDKIEWEKLNAKLKMNLYRIIQESLHNINKHAKASKVDILFEKKKGELIVKIQDNGLGFNTEKIQDGIGLKNIKSRTKDLKGKVFLNSDKKGTLITVALPIS